MQACTLHLKRICWGLANCIKTFIKMVSFADLSIVRELHVRVTRENSRRLSRKIWAGSNSTRVAKSVWEFQANKSESLYSRPITVLWHLARAFKNIGGSFSKKRLIMGHWAFPITWPCMIIILVFSSIAVNNSAAHYQKSDQSWHSTSGLHYSNIYISFLNKRRWVILQISSHASSYDNTRSWTFSYICRMAGF